MPSSWLPILNTVLPYLTSIITAAVPAFTARRENDKSANLVAEQIAELQSAVTRNAESVRVLAEQMQRTIEAVQTAALANQRTARAALATSAAAFVAAAAALGLALAAFWNA